MKLNGLKAPVGEGLVLEVHADLVKPSEKLIEVLVGAGLEDDPFCVFHPAEYTKHMTGRLRVPQKQLKNVVPKVRDLIEQIAKSSAESFYFEIELVRGTLCFQKSEWGRLLASLDCLEFSRTGKFGEARADIHVEFPLGLVLPEVRCYLENKGFYWVSTPQTESFGPEEIATLQTAEFDQGQRVYDLLSQYPLPGCTGIHLEQKLGMVASKHGLPMPEVIAVAFR